MKKIILCLSAITFIVAQAYAASYVCPRTYQTIMTGYTLQKVETACGKPESTTTKVSTQTKPVTFKQWVYTKGKGTSNNLGQTAPQMLVTFDNNKVSEISVNNQNTPSNFPCYQSGRIKVGTLAAQVQIQCGAPAYVNTIQKGYSQAVKQTVLTYNFGSYRPKMIFTFEDNKLTKIETGQLAK